MDQIPLKDVGRFVDGGARGAAAPIRRCGRACPKSSASIQPEAGLFVLEEGDEPLATPICVHDGDLAGLFEIATDAGERGQGHGRRLVLSALKWARLRGARDAWLQVEADNAPALALYRSLGFDEVYRYHYRRPPGA